MRFGMRRRPRPDSDEEGEEDHAATALDSMSDEDLRQTLLGDPPTAIMELLLRTRDQATVLRRAPVRDLLNTCEEGGNMRLPLWRACDDRQHDPSLVKDLLEAGADPWLYDEIGKPLLWCLHYRQCHDRYKNGNVRSRCLMGRYSVEVFQLVQEAMRRWTPDTHLRFPEEFQAQVFTLLLINRRNPPRVRMPKDVLHIIIRDVAAHAATWHRDRIVEAEMEEHTNWHLLTMLGERGEPYMSRRSRREAIVARLLQHAKKHGIE